MKENWKRSVALFLGGQTVSLLGSSLVQFAISWHITLTTKSGVMLTISILCGFLPQVVVSLFAGVWADRYDRRKMIVLADGMIAVSTAVLAVLFTVGYTEIWLLFVISGIRSIGSGVHMPCVGPFLTEIVPQEQLMRVNGLNASIQGMMMLVAPALAGLLLEVMGLALVFWVDVLTAVIGISLLLLIKRQRPEVERKDEHIFVDMARGFRYVVGTRWLRLFMGLYVLLSLMLGPVIFLTPLMVARSFGDEEWRLVVHEIVFAAGFMLGGLLVGVVSQRVKNKTHLLGVACFLFGATVVVMGFSMNFIFYLAIMLPMGLAVPAINSSAMTIMQTHVAPDMLGRVFGLNSIVSASAMPLSMLIFGPISDSTPVERLLLITGAAVVLVAVAMLHSKQMEVVGLVPEPVE